MILQPLPNKSDYVQKNWIFFLLLFLMQAFVVTFYVYKLSLTTQLGVPLDDTYIHYQYARNLATYGKLEFNHGEPSIGSTSFLWVLLLALFYKLGSIILISIIIEVFFSLISAFCIFEISKNVLKRDLYAFFVALLFILCGNNIWFSLSGMETAMFVALGLLSILLYSKKKIYLSSICSGLLALTRPEGLILTGIIFSYEALIQYKNKEMILKRLVILLIIPALLILPYFLYNLTATGHILPSTFSGRRWIAGLPEHINFSVLNLMFIGAWPYRIATWTFMSNLLMHHMPLTISILILVFPIFLVFFGFYKYLNMGFTSSKTITKADSCLLILLLWCILHNFMYFLILPILSHAGRYQAINLVMLWICVGLGILSFTNFLKSRNPMFQSHPIIILLFLLVTGFTIASTLDWSDWYVSSTQQINEVHVKAGKW
jgi:hypothetical protein